jgi:hypothetical protein
MLSSTPGDFHIFLCNLSFKKSSISNFFFFCTPNNFIKLYYILYNCSGLHTEDAFSGNNTSMREQQLHKWLFQRTNPVDFFTSLVFVFPFLVLTFSFPLCTARVHIAITDAAFATVFLLPPRSCTTPSSPSHASDLYVSGSFNFTGSKHLELNNLIQNYYDRLPFRSLL